MMWPLYLLLILKCILHSMQAEGILIETSVGSIQGMSADDGNYSMFLGIPYAEVDTNNPFGIATLPENFTEVFEAYDDSATCPQQSPNGSSIGTLDCLKLNVYVPDAANSSNKLPVIIWIHGGTLKTGSFNKSIYGPKFLVKQNVVLVTINYRLGPYGFMCLDTAEIPGNQGLKDQYMAIQWVKNNIAAFGGDENELTIMGQSAGSKCVELHILTQRTQLFNKAIMESGSPLGPAVVDPSDDTTPIAIANDLGNSTEDLSEALDFLAQSNPHSVIAAAIKLGLNFDVCVEKSFEGVEKFVFEHPEFSDRSKTCDIPILAGFNTNEMIVIYNNNSTFTESIFGKRLQLLFEFGTNTTMENLTRHFYLGDEEANVTTKLKIIDFLSDYTYNYPVQRSMVKFNKNGNDNIYQYLFSYLGGRNNLKTQYNITVGGAAHGDELGYLFDRLSLSSANSIEDQLVLDRLTTMWANFAKYGNPTPETSDLLPVTWSPITEDTIHYLEIGNNLTMKTKPLSKRMVFWDLFFDTYSSYFKPNLGYFD